MPGQLGRVLKSCTGFLGRPWTYAGGAVIVLVLVTSLELGGIGQAACNESPQQLASRLSELEKTFNSTYQEESADIQTCQSLDCERPAKLEIAGALRSYDQGLGHICWPSSDQALLNGLITANSSAAMTYNEWADATTPGDDQVIGTEAERAVASQQAALRRLSNRLDQ